MAINALSPASTNWGERDIYLMNIPLYQIGASSIMLGLVFAGAGAVATYGTNPVEMLELIRKEKITVIVRHPTLFVGLLLFPLEKYDLGSVRTFCWFGGSIPLEVLRKWMEICPDVEIRLVHASGKDVLDGEPGEGIMRSPSIMLGYYKDNEGTARTLRQGWLHTGDVLIKGQDGNHYYYDRIKDMIKSGGVNVACLEVEEVLNRHPDVEISDVLSAPHPYWTEGVAAVVVPRRDSLDADQIAERAKKNLAGYKIPKRVIMLKASDLPASPTRKTLKRELPEMYKDIYQGEKGK
jgi:acyl-CoA synthetase (AMP-forming)/AMP-acid ligase II